MRHIKQTVPACRSQDLKCCSCAPHLGSCPVAAVGCASAQCEALGRGASKGQQGSAAAGLRQGALCGAGGHWSSVPTAGDKPCCGEQQLPACTPTCWRWLLCPLHDCLALLRT